MSETMPSPAATMTSFDNLEIDKVVSTSEQRVCWKYVELFKEQSLESLALSDRDGAASWRILQEICTFHFKPEDTKEPFGPMATFPDGTRTMIPSDIDDVSAQALHHLAGRLLDAELRARVRDVVWERLRKVDSAESAVNDYLLSGKNLQHPERWVWAVERYERALRLAAMLKNQRLFDSCASSIFDTIVDLDGADQLYMSAHLIELLADFRYGDAERLAVLTEKAATAAAVASDFERARTHWRNAAALHKQRKDFAKEAEARIAEAECYCSQAELHERGQGGAGTASHFWQQGLVALRNIKGTDDRRKEVYERLRQSQKKALEDFGHIHGDEIDISKIVKMSREHVSGKAKLEALVALAMAFPITKFEKVGANVDEIMKMHPLRNMITNIKVASDGRTIAKTGSAFSRDPAERAAVRWARIVENAQLNYGVQVQAMILPARDQILLEHRITIRDIGNFVLHNPIIPPGNEGFIAEGLLAGLNNDMAASLALLVPQVEAILRHLLRQRGVEPSTLNKHGIQQVDDLGDIFHKHRDKVIEIIGQDATDDLRVLLHDPQGPAIRHEMMHGTLAYNSCYAPSCIYLWWFILRLVLGAKILTGDK